MGDRLTRKRLALLEHLATYRILTAEQAAVLQGSGMQAARKRLASLLDMGLVEAIPQGYGRLAGRPGRLYHLSRKGITNLRSHGFDPLQQRYDPQTAGGISAVDHQLLLNWCLLHLLHLEQTHPPLAVSVTDSPSSLIRQDSSSSIASADAPDVTIPDAVFGITCQEQGKTLLFFLEVDMATETVASPTRSRSDFRSKIVRYHRYLSSAGYKGYEPSLPHPLRGFRLLVVTPALRRLTSLCRLVGEMPPADFIWLTDQPTLFRAGFSGPIWVPGGQQDAPAQSIVGPTLACAAPLLPVKP